jgi:hypothetical protein
MSIHGHRCDLQLLAALPGFAHLTDGAGASLRGSACQSSSKQDSNDHTLAGHLIYRTQRSQSPGDCSRVTSAASCRLQEVENGLCNGTMTRNTERM